MSNTSRIWSTADFAGLGNNLPTKLDGVQVSVNNLPAAVYSIDPAQINFQVPNGVTVCFSPCDLQRPGQQHPDRAGCVQRAGHFPGDRQRRELSSRSLCGWQVRRHPAANAVFRKAKPGDVIQLYATGLAATPAGVEPSLQSVSGVTVTIGSVTFPADFAGLVAVGEFQINFTVPQQIADGTYPISIQVNGASSPATINTNPQARLSCRSSVETRIEVRPVEMCIREICAERSLTLIDRLLVSHVPGAGPPHLGEAIRLFRVALEDADVVVRLAGFGVVVAEG